MLTPSGLCASRAAAQRPSARSDCRTIRSKISIVGQSIIFLQACATSSKAYELAERGRRADEQSRPRLAGRERAEPRCGLHTGSAPGVRVQRLGTSLFPQKGSRSGRVRGNRRGLPGHGLERRGGDRRRPHPHRPRDTVRLWTMLRDVPGTLSFGGTILRFPTSFDELADTIERHLPKALTDRMDLSKRAEWNGGADDLEPPAHPATESCWAYRNGICSCRPWDPACVRKKSSAEGPLDDRQSDLFTGRDQAA